MKNKKWFKLDNAAKIYPAFANKYDTGTFRVAAILKDKVNPNNLQIALDKILKRFPSMTVQMKKGLFWYYFDENEKQAKIALESQLPCSQINDEDNFLFKVMYFNNRISLECFHALTDGYGAFEFLKTLLCEYVDLEYKHLDNTEGVISVKDTYSIDELEDSYKRYAVQTQNDYKDEKAFKLKGKLIPYEGSFVHHTKLSADKIHQLAKSYNTTITVVLTAIYIESLMTVNKTNKPIVVTIPVNLRKQFSSKTLRNFTYVVNIGVSKESYTSFDTLLSYIDKQLKTKTKSEFLLSKFSKNVLIEDAMWLKLTPNGLKDWILKIAKNKVHDKFSTGFISNPGIITLPEEMQNYVNHMEFILYASKAQPVNMGICTYNNQLLISLSRVLEEKRIIEVFNKNLSKHLEGHMTYYSNERNDHVSRI